MNKERRDRLASFALLPAVLIAVGILAYFTFRTTFQIERLRQQSVLEATLGLANEKADRLDKQIVDQDNVAAAIADPAIFPELSERWLPTAQRETPSVRAIVVLDNAGSVLAFASRAGGAWGDEEAFRRLLVQRMLRDMNLREPVEELRHLHKEYGGEGYLVSYWQRSFEERRYLIVAWHDIGRIVKETLPALYSETAASPAVASPPSRVNVVDEEGRIIFGPPLRSGEFTVGVRFPTTLYNWRLQVSPTASEDLSTRVQSRRTLELVMLVLSSLVIVAGVATILLAAEKERRISALKSDFVANVSHELKTPLALVRMFAEMLHSGRIPSEQKRQEYLEIIVRESERLSNLIENVLDFAKVERGRESYEFCEGDVGAAVERAVTVYRYRAEREGVELEVDIARDLPRTRLDERAVQLAVINLVDNALKYGRPTHQREAQREAQGDRQNAPSGHDRITVHAAREGGAIAVRVIDDGPGVPVEDRARIFERFVRGSRVADKNPVRGSGIGLALVKHIAESHGGEAWVEPAARSRQQRGACFVFTIPLRSGRGPSSSRPSRPSYPERSPLSTDAKDGSNSLY